MRKTILVFITICIAVFAGCAEKEGTFHYNQIDGIAVSSPSIEENGEPIKIQGITLTEEDLGEFLGFDIRSCFPKSFRNYGMRILYGLFPENDLSKPVMISCELSQKQGYSNDQHLFIQFIYDTGMSEYGHMFERDGLVVSNINGCEALVYETPSVKFNTDEMKETYVAAIFAEDVSYYIEVRDGNKKAPFERLCKELVQISLQ